MIKNKILKKISMAYKKENNAVTISNSFNLFKTYLNVNGFVRDNYFVDYKFEIQ